MKAVVCSWCQIYRPGKDPRVVGRSASGGHGICEECRLRFMAEAVAEMDEASPCCGLIGQLLERQSRAAHAVWRQCPCGHIYIERQKAQKG